MLIAQISDSHIAAPGMKTYGIAPMAENLLACINHINRFEPAVDLVFISGDITKSSRADEYEHALSIFNKLQAPYYLIPGNHDDREKLLHYFSPSACHSTGSDRDDSFINYVVDDYEIRILALDTTHPGEPGGHLCQQRLDWLDQKLQHNKNKPTVIFMHHPPIKIGVIETDLDGFIGAEGFAEIVKQYSNIERIACGHVHLPTFSQFSGTVVSTAPAIGMHLFLDLTLKHPSQFVLRNPAYQLHHWTPDKNLVSHTIEVNADNTAYLFEDHKV